MFQLYTAGFAFSKDASKVALIRKNRPAWQAGKLNAIGGHVEFEEPTIMAQVREYREETGVESLPSDWNLLGTLSGTDFQVTFYYSTNEDLLNVQSTTDEHVAVYDYPLHHGDLMHNLPWLIEAARDNILRPDQRVILKARQ